MALEIVDTCVNCWACIALCPNQAIFEASPHFQIDPLRCSECVGDYAKPQCAEICPVEGAIVNELGEALYPPGTLSPPLPGQPNPTLAER